MSSGKAKILLISDEYRLVEAKMSLNGILKMRKMKKDIYRMIFTVEIQWSSLEEALGEHSASRAASFRGLFEYFSIFYGSVDD